MDKNKADLKKIPLEINGRLKIRPNINNEVYEFEKNLIHYNLEKAIPEFSKFGHNIADKVGRVGKCEHSFQNSKGEIEQLDYWNIGVWDKVPQKYRDIIFFHELKEMEYMTKGLPQPEAHRIARKEELGYISKYLNDKDRISWMKNRGKI